MLPLVELVRRMNMFSVWISFLLSIGGLDFVSLFHLCSYLIMFLSTF